MESTECKSLSYAIVLQAIEDWRWLCEGNKESCARNFIELEKFFKKGCDTYLLGTDIRAKDILKKLMHERAVSNYKEKAAKKDEAKAKLKEAKMFTLKSQKGVI